uniref:Uncharacterized protein n=1 Tax=Anguilla anguilla TaxID=7936 RepID=A0A0E9SJW9_ANGAN
MDAEVNWEIAGSSKQSAFPWTCTALQMDLGWLCNASVIQEQKFE